MSELQTLLCVEDEPDIRAILELSLQKLGGFNVVTCGSGEEALECLVDVSPQLILLDVMMPGMDGPSTLKAMRKVDGYARVPVAFLTAKVQPKEVDDFLAHGAVGVIAKPFDPISLPDEVRRLWQEAQA